MTAMRTKKVAPDGGWAWMVCLGASIVNFSTRSLEPSFGLLFGDLLKSLGVATTGASVIMSTLDCMVNFSGFFVGPVIKTFSYRKVCVFGAFISAVALICTAPANSMTHILATYSIMGGFGVGFASSSSFVSLNHFFSKKRGQAVGLSMAGTGLGLMVMPQLVRLLLAEFGFRGAVLILGGLAFHAVLGACLLQPVERHLIEVPIDEEGQVMKEMDRIDETEEEAEDRFEADALMAVARPIRPAVGMPRAATCEQRTLRDLERGHGVLLGLPKRPTMPAMPRIMSACSVTHEQQLRRRKESVISSLSNMDFTGSNLHIYIDAADDDLGINMNTSRKSSQILKGDKSMINNNDQKQAKPEGFFKRFIGLMDLDLLKDLSYLNLLFGLSIFWVGELNFRMITPFFISNMGYSKTETAFCLSVTAVTDILVRLILPPIFDRKKISKKLIFFFSALFLVMTRSVLAEQTEWIPLLVWLSICGFFRGCCLSNFTLTISECCTLEKLPAAFGLHMVAKGLFVLVLGPLVGFVRDYTDSYPICIHFQNFFIMLCVLAWGIEYALGMFRTRKIVQIK